MLIIETLLQLQAVDTAADQLRHRLTTLPELDAARRARADLLDWERRRTELRARASELEALVQAAESESAEIDRQRARLEAQLRTVIAPREAEALQHEIATLDRRRGEIDDRELEALEEESRLDDEVVAHAEPEQALRDHLAMADAGLAAVQSDIDSELAELERRRADARAALPSDVLATYDRLRAQLGVAVARLSGARCEGCHLDMSPAELDAVKAVPADQIAECPQCSRLLAR